MNDSKSAVLQFGGNVEYEISRNIEDTYVETAPTTFGIQDLGTSIGDNVHSTSNAAMNKTARITRNKPKEQIKTSTSTIKPFLDFIATKWRKPRSIPRYHLNSVPDELKNLQQHF